MDTTRDPIHDEDVTLFGDVLLLYLSIGTVMGDCDLYRRMGHALATEDMEGLRRLRGEFDALHPVLRERILAGSPLAPEADTGRAEPTDEEDADEADGRITRLHTA